MSDHSAEGTGRIAPRLAVLDDHPIVLNGIRALALVDDPPVIPVVLESSEEEFLAAVDSRTVDVALVDLTLGQDMRGQHVIRTLTNRGVPCAVYTAEIRPLPVRRAVEAGALGVVLKNDPLELLLRTLTTVAAGEPAVAGELAQLLMSDRTLLPKLSRRELEVLSMLHQGVPRKAVGRLLNPPAADATVATHLRRVVEKYREIGLHVSTVGDAVHAASREGWFD